MATECLQCGKPLEVKRYRQCTTFCSLKCSRKHMHNRKRSEKEFMSQLRKDNKPEVKD